MVQHNKKISDQPSGCAQIEDKVKEWKYQKKSIAGGLVVNTQEFIQGDRSRTVEAYNITLYII